MATKLKFSKFTKWFAKKAGHPLWFLWAFTTVIIWALTGPIFHYSDTWQLVINTTSSVFTFLMVFLIQNSQNRETLAIQLKLDELLRAHKGAHNELLDIEQLTDEEIEALYKRYVALSKSEKKKLKSGKPDTGVPPIKKKRSS